MTVEFSADGETIQTILTVLLISTAVTVQYADQINILYKSDPFELDIELSALISYRVGIMLLEIEKLNFFFSVVRKVVPSQFPTIAFMLPGYSAVDNMQRSW
jgi:hypothetical protein